MPFPYLIDLIKISTNYYNVKNSCRKEEKVDYISCTIFCLMEKASVSASYYHTSLGGSITVEAAVCVPLFLYASICLIWMLEIRLIESTVRGALQAAGKELAVELCEVPLLIPSYLERKIVEDIGDVRLERSCIRNGANGLHCEKSYLRGQNGVMELKVEYYVNLPVPGFMIPPIKQRVELRVKSWVGYEKLGISIPTNEKIVYITETGIVYHENYECAYLNPSIKVVSPGQLEELRNKDGGIYYPCSECMEFQVYLGNIYITDYGDRYHSKISCSALKRKIYAVPISEVHGKGGCSKCVN